MHDSSQRDRVLIVSIVSTGHTIIVGGGIVGLSAAYHLARRGCEVTLLERDDFTTSASTGNAGIIALGHPPMPRPGLIGQTMKMMFNPLNPLYIPPRLDPQLWRWMWRFRQACSERQFRHSMSVLAELGWHAGRAFDELVDDEQLDCQYSRSGWIDVFRTPRRLEQGLSEAELLRGYGYAAKELSGEELAEQHSAFLPGVAGAVHYTDSRFANPGRVLLELADRAARRGATVRTGAEVTRIETRNERFTGVQLSSGESLRGDTLVLASGTWSSRLAKDIGISVPMQPGKGYHITLAAEPGNLPGTTCVLAETFVAVTPISGPSGGTLRLAGTVELSGINHTMVRKRLDMLRVGARQYLRGIDDAPTTSEWCGLRPCTADGLPVVGWAGRVAKVFVATGHAMMGFALGPVTGKLAAEAIADGETSFDLTPLSPSRFDRRNRRTPAAGRPITARSAMPERVATGSAAAHEKI